MATSKTMEDWFLRGGEKPRDNGMQAYVCGPTVAVAVCQNCGGGNLADEEQCTHCGAPLRGGTPTDEYCGTDDDDGYEDDEDEDGEREFTVTVRRTWMVQQEAKIKIIAEDEEAAMMKAEDIAAEDDEIDWDTVPDSDDYDDIEATNAEES